MAFEKPYVLAALVVMVAFGMGMAKAEEEAMAPSPAMESGSAFILPALVASFCASFLSLFTVFSH
ncbi:hypothetical protein AMTRI_Chr03g45110 [Amborella trichopoda]